MWYIILLNFFPYMKKFWPDVPAPFPGTNENKLPDIKAEDEGNNPFLMHSKSLIPYPRQEC